MKNVSLKTKIAILVGVLIATVLAVGLVGVLELGRTNERMRQLVDQNGRAVTAAARIRELLLSAIRAEKNAVLARDDAIADRFAKEAQESARQIDASAPELRRLVSAVEAGADYLAEFDRNWEAFQSNQAEVLRLAVLNTNVRASGLLHTEASERFQTLDRLMSGIQLRQSVEDAPGDAPSTGAGLDKRASQVSLLTADIRLKAAQLTNLLDAHIAAKQEAGMNELDSRIEAIHAQLQTTLEALKAFVNGSDRMELSQAAIELQELRKLAARIQELSRINSNEKSVELTLTRTVEFGYKCVGSLSRLSDDLGKAALAERDSAEAAFHRAVGVTTSAAVLGIVAALIMGRLVARSVTRPVAQGVELAHALAQGDLTRRLRLAQHDEIGRLTTAIDQAAENFSAIVAEIHDVATQIGASADELTGVSHRLLAQSEEMSTQAGFVAGSTEQMTTNINSMASAAEQMSMNVASISSASEEISVNVGAISTAAAETSENVNGVVAAIQAATQSFEAIAVDARQGAQVTAKAAELAANATTTMNSLDRSAGEISKVTEMIKLIAMQTNLLALNATIEATSAGEAGKGFAVVASEIKELANQSGKSAEDIARMIESIQSGTRGAVAVIGDVAETIQSVNTASARISHAVEEETRQASASAEKLHAAGRGVGHIAQSIKEVAKGANDMSRNASEAAQAATDVSRNAAEAASGTREVSSNIRGVSDATRENTSSAQQVNQAAERLQCIAVNLDRIVGRFRLGETRPHDGKPDAEYRD
jgi:methyl-accepting chemotaxis protein